MTIPAPRSPAASRARLMADPLRPPAACVHSLRSRSHDGTARWEGVTTELSLTNQNFRNDPEPRRF